MSLSPDSDSSARELAERLTKLSALIPGMIYQFKLRPDGTTCLPYASEGIREVFGLTPEEVRHDASKTYERVHPDDLPGLVQSIQESAAHLSRWSHEVRLRLPDGTIRWVNGTSVPERQPDGSIVWHGFMSDVTEIRRAGATATANAARLDHIYRHVPGVIYQFVLRPDGTRCMPFASDAIQELFEVTPAQVADDATPLLNKILPEDLAVLNAGIEESARTLKPHHHEFRVRRANGAIAWLRGDSMPERDGAGNVVWNGFITDVTESRRLETKLMETAKLESLGVLAGGIAHDFNNLLTGILGNASLARQELPPASLGQPMLDQIETAARRAADLCKQMLAYSGKGRFVVQRLNVNKLIEDTTHLLQISIAKNCVLRFNLAADLPPVKADATQLRQVIMNLVINASEAIGSRSGVLALSTGVARVDGEYVKGFRPDASPVPGDYVFIEVSDNGCGMDSATLAKIFDPFFTTKFTGRGLGLAAVLGIVRGHRGGLKVYSEPGRGTTFKLFFPVASGRAQESASPFPETAPFKGSGTVLVVDDEETVRTVAARMLERLGFTVVTANDGRDGLEKFRADPARFTLVLLDLTMPHLDGEETFRQMRVLNPQVRVILTSGFNQMEAVNRFTGKGLAGFIQKPFELTGLIQVVRSVLPHG
jgi:PAS domain S-box-containing protein